MTNRSIELVDIEGSPDLHHFISENCDHLENLSPYPSTLKLRLVKLNGDSEGSLDLKSEALTLSLTAQNRSLPQLLIQLFRSLEMELKKWELTRAWKAKGLQAGK